MAGDGFRRRPILAAGLASRSASSTRSGLVKRWTRESDFGCARARRSRRSWCVAARGAGPCDRPRAHPGPPTPLQRGHGVQGHSRSRTATPCVFSIKRRRLGVQKQEARILAESGPLGDRAWSADALGAALSRMQELPTFCCFSSANTDTRSHHAQGGHAQRASGCQAGVDERAAGLHDGSFPGNMWLIWSGSRLGLSRGCAL